MIIATFLAARLKEPSSYAGLGMLLAALGIHVDDTVLQAVIQAAIGIAGLVAVLAPEKKPAPPSGTTLHAIGALLLIAAAGGMLGGCQTAAPSRGQSATPAGASGASGPLQALAQFTVADLQAADADAKTHADSVASTCYEALVPLVQAQGSANSPGIKGAVTVFQATRDLATAGQSAVLKGLNVACAPLVLDATGTVVGLAAKIGLSLPLP